MVSLQRSLHLSKSSVAQYILAFVMIAIILRVLYWYTAISAEMTGLRLYNRTASSGTILLLGIVLLLGPFSRVFKGMWCTLFIVRKELGVLTFFTGLLHVYLSMFPLARNGPWGFYLSRPVSAYLGLFGLILFALLFLFSFTKIERLLSAHVWWRLQYLGARTAFVSIVLHTVFLRWSSWSLWLLGWIKRADVGYPPLALLIFVFSLYVLSIRFIERCSSHEKLKKYMIWSTLGFLMLGGVLFF